MLFKQKNTVLVFLKDSFIKSKDCEAEQITAFQDVQLLNFFEEFYDFLIWLNSNLSILS
jgi:hypothetical protein